MGENGQINVLGDLWDLAKARLRAEIPARDVFSNQDARYAVDEYGQAYLRGNASTRASLTGAIGEVHPLVLVVAVVASAGLLYAALNKG